jgi:hypothetical protein
MSRLAKIGRIIDNRAGNSRSLAERKGAFASTGLASADLMGVGNQLTIPRLDGTPLEHRFSAGDTASIALAQTLLELDIALAEDWVAATRDPRAYVLKTLDRWIAAHGGDAIKRRFDLYATLTGCLDEYSERNEENPDGSRLYLTIDPDKSGFVVLRPTLELLKEVNPRAPVSFVHLFIRALNKWVRVYDYRDAQERVAMLHDWVEGEEDPDQYEFPDVEGCIPASMKCRPFGRKKLREIASQVKHKQAKALLNSLLELSEVSEQAKRPELTDEMREELCDTNPPLPSLLAVFNQDDAIEGCFDEEAQTMMAVTPEPSVIIPLNAHEPDSVRQAFHTFGVVCKTMAAASRLIDRMPGNDQWVIQRQEEKHGGADQNRS